MREKSKIKCPSPAGEHDAPRANPLVSPAQSLVHGYKFRRQMEIGSFIVDFVCLEKRLVVELDGRGHLEQAEYDESRTRWLQSQGFRVVRFWNAEMEENIETVMQQILARLREFTPHPPAPSPARGEGEKGI